MTAYIEYVFLENFFLDGVLLLATQRFTKTPVRWIRTVCSAGLGGVYALVSPFVRLPIFLNWLLKICVGSVLCLCAYGRIKTKKQWGRYAFFLSSFLLFTFVVAGFLLSVYDELPQKPPFLMVLFTIVVGIVGVELFWSVHKKNRLQHTYVYDCCIVGEKRVKARGYLDSGNVAIKDGLPVCFVSPLVFFEAFSCVGVGEKLVITTVAGRKEIPVYRGEIFVKSGGESVKREVYFSPSKHIVLRDYELILPKYIFEEW